MKLYEYDDLIDTLLGMDEEGIDGETGLVFDVTLLDKLEMERGEKIENLLLYTAQLTADAEDISDYIAKLTARAKAKKDKADSLKKWLADEITRYGDKAFETQRIKATVRTTDKVNIIDQSLLPAEFLRFKPAPAPEPDKTAIKNAIKAGQQLSGAELVASKTVQIK